MSWYTKGYDGLAKEEARQASSQTPNRFWVPLGEKREFVFIDAEPACIYEHNPKMNGSWRNWMTCLKDIEDPCPACEIFGEKTRYYVGFQTVVDTTAWKDKKGNTHQFEVSLFAAKFGSLKKLRRKKDDAATDGREMVGALYRAARDGDKEPSIGGEFEYIRPADVTRLFDLAVYRGKKLSELYDKAEQNAQAMESLKNTFQVEFDAEGKLLRKIVPFNYMQLLHPKPRKELLAMLKGSKMDSDEQGGGTDGGDSDIPF